MMQIPGREPNTPPHEVASRGSSGLSRRELFPLLAGGALAPIFPRVSFPFTGGDGGREYPAKLIEDPILREQLERFQDWKFGLFMHWGIYSVWGAVESWPMEGAEGYGRPSLPQWKECNGDLEEFRRRYRALKKEFNPQQFDVNPWVEAAKAAGMRYCIFTTKHHDGFCMFPTAHTDFRVGDSGCPFHDDPRSDVAGVIFSAFRKAGFATGAYFSKPDWNHRDFWDPELPAPNKYPNYDVAAHPKRWEKFKKFLHAQVEELMSQYHPDILWFDGSWVQAPKYDIDIDAVANAARGKNRRVIVVDRWVAGPHENYYTPEQKIPPAPLAHPWESCISMGDQWSFKPEERYKSVRQLVHLLVEVVAKGGNLLLNIGPGPDGRWDPIAHDRMEGIASWMSVNAEAIHGTRSFAPYRTDRVAFTQKGKTLYVIHLAQRSETGPPPEIIFPLRVAEGSKVTFLGAPRSSEPLVAMERDGSTRVQIPTSIRQAPPCADAWTLKIEGR